MPKLLCQHPGCQAYPMKGGEFCRWHRDLVETMKPWQDAKFPVTTEILSESEIPPAIAKLDAEIMAIDEDESRTLVSTFRKFCDGHEELEGCPGCINYQHFPDCCNGVRWRCEDWDLMYHYQPV